MKKSINEIVAERILELVVLDNGGPLTSGIYDMYSQDDINDMYIAIELLRTEIKLFAPILSYFPDFDVEQFTTVIEWFSSPEYNEFERFIEKYPEFKPIHEIMNRPF